MPLIASVEQTLAHIGEHDRLRKVKFDQGATREVEAEIEPSVRAL